MSIKVHNLNIRKPSDNDIHPVIYIRTSPNERTSLRPQNHRLKSVKASDNVHVRFGHFTRTSTLGGGGNMDQYFYLR